MSTKTAKINLKAASLDDRNEALQRFVREVAEFLPEWEYQTPEYGHLARLTWASEFEGYHPVISARVDGGRVVFTGQWPHGTYQKVYSAPVAPSATADVNREPRLVASQIVYRLIPTFLAGFEQVAKRLREADASENAMKATAERLAKPGGWRVFEDSTFTAWGPERAGYAEVKVYHGGEQVNVDARGVTVEQAEAILAIIERG